MSTFGLPPLSSSPIAPLTPKSARGRNGAGSSVLFSSPQPSTTPAGPPPSARSILPSYLDSPKLNRKSGLANFSPSAESSSTSSRFQNSASNPNQSVPSSNAWSNSPPQRPPATRLAKHGSPPTAISPVHQDMGTPFKVTKETRGLKSFGIGENTVNQFPLPENIPYNPHDYLEQFGQNIRSTASPAKSVRRQNRVDLLADSVMSAPATSKPKTISKIGPIAESIANGLAKAEIADSEAIIDDTEHILEELFVVDSDEGISEEDLDRSLSDLSDRLGHIWDSTWDLLKRRASPDSDAPTFGFGPTFSETPLLKAIYVASLILPLHHPPIMESGPPEIFQPSWSDPRKEFIERYATAKPFPKILLDWQERYHNPWTLLTDDVQRAEPSPPAHFQFWPVAFSLVLRGKLRQAANLLYQSSFENAETARQDGQIDGYTAMQLKNIESTVKKAAQVLELCPAVESDDWDVLDSAWSNFRARVRSSLNELTEFAENRESNDASLSHSTFMASNQLSHSQIARRAASRVPWTIYSSLRVVYGILLGKSSEIISSSSDWLEASLCLSIWWDGDMSSTLSIRHNRQLTKNSIVSPSRAIDRPADSVIDSYLDRLKHSFREATRNQDEYDLPINTNSPIEVVIACALEGDLENVLRFCRSWSLPVADALSEVAVVGRWPNMPRDRIMAELIELDADDMEVLGQNAYSDKPLTKDVILKEYASTIVNVQRGSNTDPQKREGWEIALELLRRLDDEAISQREMAALLFHLTPTSDLQIHNILTIATEYGLSHPARRITEAYADQKALSPSTYGSALLHYARAHKPAKIEAMLGVLTATSLLRSAAYPSRAEMDGNMQALLRAPKDALFHIAAMDEEAASLLHKHFAAYASLCTFYELRDKPEHDEKDKTSMSMALITVIDNICITTADTSNSSISFPVDALLPLLGEALFLHNQERILLSDQQCFQLLRALEFLENIDEQTFARCDRFFRATLKAYHDKTCLPSPSELIKKSQAIESDSPFDAVNAAMTDDAMLIEADAAPAAKPSVQVQDWRAAFDCALEGQRLMGLLRVSIARHFAKVWINGSHAD